MKPVISTLHWQSYACNCTSPAVEDESQLPKVCPKHNEPYTQRYISNKVRQSVEQIDDREPRYIETT